ncbi:hypothetical protein DOY81_004935, partial [Sarcophaga bullata]
ISSKNGNSLCINCERLISILHKLFLVAGTILVSLVISMLCIGLTVRYEVDTETADVKSVSYWKLKLPQEQDFWFEKGIEELRTIIVKKEQRGDVSNVIIFMAEGINSDMLSRARFKSNDSALGMNNFIWDTFPHLGILKSSCSFKQTCDAFTLSSGLFGGIKTSPGLGGVDARVAKQNCYQAQNHSYYIRSIFKQAKELNLRTGFVTTGRITAPLMAGLYAHSSDTQWECDAAIPENLKSTCKDIAKQLIHTKEGRQINVIMGGGRQTLVSRVPISNLSQFDTMACDSLDKRNLLKDWQSYKLSENVTFKLLETTKGLQRFKGSSYDHVLGVFANGDVQEKGPSLTQMVSKSLGVLSRKEAGYILVVETATKSKGVQEFQQVLRNLNETIYATFKHRSFKRSSTIVLTVFLDLSHTASSPNDIFLYASGPKSYLFHGIHEETYMAHVIAYSLKMDKLITNATTLVKAKTFGITVPYELPPDVRDVCPNLMYDAYCPLYSTEDVTYLFLFPIADIYPEISVNIEIYIEDQDSKNGQPFPLSVDVEGCDQPPCDVIKGSSAIMDVQFVG